MEDDGITCRNHWSRDMTKPTKWVCAQRSLKSAWASAQSDQSLRCALNVAKDPSFLHADSLYSDQTNPTNFFNRRSLVVNWDRRWDYWHLNQWRKCHTNAINVFTNILSLSLRWAPSSEFVSSSIPSWQILTAHAQPFRGARDLAFCLKVPLDSLFVWASSGGSGETARMRRLDWTFAARIGDKYQIRLTRPTVTLIKRKSVEHAY